MPQPIHGRRAISPSPGLSVARKPVNATGATIPLLHCEPSDPALRRRSMARSVEDRCRGWRSRSRSLVRRGRVPCRWRDARRVSTTVPRPAIAAARIRGPSTVVLTPLSGCDGARARAATRACLQRSARLASSRLVGPDAKQRLAPDALSAHWRSQGCSTTSYVPQARKVHRARVVATGVAVSGASPIRLTCRRPHASAAVDCWRARGSHSGPSRGRCCSRSRLV